VKADKPLAGILETRTMSTQEKLIHLVDDHHGIYSPQIFAETMPRATANPEDWDAVLAGPGHAEYWEAWEGVILSWNLDGYTILESEGLFLVHESIDPENLDEFLG
jgi:hypothetical protein